MKNRMDKLFNWLKTHKLLLGIMLAIVLISIFGVRPRVTAYLEGPAEKYETSKVKKEDLEAVISASGDVQAENQVTLKFQTSGKLAWVGVREGDKVEKWQTIASLDKIELKKTLKKEMNDYLEERWDFAEDREDYNVSSDDLDKYTLSNDIRRLLEKAQFDLNNTVLDVEIADLAVKYATLFTPIQGIVTNVEAPVAGVNITPATAEFTVADPTKMKFVANVDEADIGNLQIGQRVVIVLDSYLDKEFVGSVNNIAFSAITTRGGGTAFPIEIFLPPNEAERFRVGMNGDAEIILEARTNALTVPTEAVRIKNGGRYVQIIENKEIKEITVKTGLESDTRVEIISGLAEGQVVITGEKSE
ncbi:efflux RND transporter periplasmic adaptor subunit [Patescibacteria group bacterium]